MVDMVIRRMRLERGGSRRQLGARRYTDSYMPALENGLARPSRQALTHLAHRLLVAARAAWTGRRQTTEMTIRKQSRRALRQAVAAGRARAPSPDDVA